MFKAGQKSIAEAGDPEAGIRTQLADSVMKRWTMLHTDMHAAYFSSIQNFKIFFNARKRGHQWVQ